MGSPTWTYRLALQIKELLKTDAKGTFHCTSENHCSRADYARHIMKHMKIKTSIESCTMSDYKQLAKRPKNCILENRLLKKIGINVMQDWKADLDNYLEQYGKELLKQIKIS